MYLYLSLQRALIYLSCFIVVCSLTFAVATNFLQDPELDIFNLEWTNSLFINVLFGNKELVLHTWQWVQVSLCFIITVATLITVVYLHLKARRVYAKIHPFAEDYNDDWLRSHTLLIRGLLKSDTKGELLESILNERLERHGGRVMNLKVSQADSVFRKLSTPSSFTGINDKVLVVQDYKKFTKIEEKREEFEDTIYFSGPREPTFSK